MPRERLLHVLTLLSRDGVDLATDRLCQVGAQVTAMTGTGLMLMWDDIQRGSLCSTDDVSAVIEDLQYTLGEGPCVDAYQHARPVLEPDLAEPDVARWVAFTPPAVAAGARAVFGFPLQVGAVRLGALNLYRDRPGPLTDDQHAYALVMADVAAQAMLAMQAKAPPGALAAELEAGVDLQSVVHQASGMVSVQLGIGVGEALARMRAHAFAHDRQLHDVAHDVVDRRLRFEPGSGSDDDATDGGQGRVPREG